MALTPANAEVAVTGALLVGAIGATAPTAIDSATTGYTDLGLLGEDGITESHDGNVEKLRAWQNGQTVRTIRTEGSVTFQFMLLETTEAGVELAYGTTVTSGAYLIDMQSTRDHHRFILDVLDGDESERVFIADGEVIELGDVVRVNNAIKGYPITIEAYYDSTYGNAKVWSTRLGATGS